MSCQLFTVPIVLSHVCDDSHPEADTCSIDAPILLQTRLPSVLPHTDCVSVGCLQSNPGLQKLVAGAFGLPFGLFMVLVCGAELFTGNTCIMAAAMYAGAIKPGDLIKNWILSYGGATLTSCHRHQCSVHSHV